MMQSPDPLLNRPHNPNLDIMVRKQDDHDAWKEFLLAIGTFFLNLWHALGSFWQGSESDLDAIPWPLHGNVISEPPQSVVSAIPYGRAPGDILPMSNACYPVDRPPRYGYTTQEVADALIIAFAACKLPLLSDTTPIYTPPPDVTPLLIEETGYERESDEDRPGEKLRAAPPERQPPQEITQEIPHEARRFGDEGVMYPGASRSCNYPYSITNQLDIATILSGNSSEEPREPRKRV